MTITACASEPVDAADTVDAAHVALLAQDVTCTTHRYQRTRETVTTVYRAELPLRAVDFPRLWVRACYRIDMPPIVPCTVPVSGGWTCTGDVPPALDCTVSAVTTYTAAGTFAFDCGRSDETLVNGTWTSTIASYYPSVTVQGEP